MSAGMQPPIIEVESDRGPTLEPVSKRLPIGPDHILYPILVAVALPGILVGSRGRDVADDMPAEETHPFFPDHFWPYPVIAVIMVITFGLLAAVAPKILQLDGSADPRAVINPRPDWYFLFLFQFLKLGPEWITSLLIPAMAVVGLLSWPLIDSIAGPKLARRLGWKAWPVPGRNRISGTLLMIGLGTMVLLTIWALAGPGFCLPWVYNGPVCGA